ncbi:MAG: 30S ribosomal protein S1 [Thermodesulfovibrionales bacterium]
MEIKNNEMEKLYAETFHRIEEGEILKGRVIHVRHDGIMVDIGYKSEGFIPAEEFSPTELQSVNIDDTLDVYVVDIQDSEGIVLLSREKALKIKAWESLESALEKGQLLEGFICGKAKNGFNVDILGIKAFLPASQIDNKSLKEIDSLIGKTMKFKILKLDQKKSSVLVSRKAAAEEERQERKMETLGKLREGARLKGVVKNITDYGVFVDLGGIDGLLHISDISWGRLSHPSEVFKIGDSVEVIVLKFDPDNERVTLGYKQKRPDPWLSVNEKYPVGLRVKGKVTSITDYGAFIELEEGVEGLVHVSEMDWLPRPKHPSKYLEVGEFIDAMVLKVDKEERRISLSIKQLKPSPWEVISRKYKVGDKVSGKVKSLTEFGAFVGLPEGVDGLIHISDMSWTRHINHPSEILRRGQKIEAIVLNIEPDKERIALGLKQLTPDPWLKEIPERYTLGTEVRCKVLKSSEFGLFVEIEGEVEGLVYSSEILKREEPYKEGDEIIARIIKIDTDERKIGLSMKYVKGDKS